MKRINELALESVRYFWRWAGGTATPQQPWTVRREELIKLADKGYLQSRNPRRSRSRALDRQWNRDIERLIEEGVMRRVRQCRNASMGRTWVVLVDPLPEPPEPEVRVPYAKRKAGIAEFKEKNPKRNA